MIEENEYIKQIWEKYDICKKNSIIREKYKKQIYKTGKNKLIAKSLFSLIIVLFSTVSATYAGVIGYKAIAQKFMKTDYNIIEDYSQDEEMKYDDGIYYQKIMTYEKYKECCNKWTNLVEMTEEDFKDNFVLVLSIESATKLGVSISNIEADENTMKVLFKRDLNKNYYDDFISAKIDKKLNRPNIAFKIEYNSGTFTNLEELSTNYTAEQALADGCVVLNDQKMQGNSLDIWETFFKNIQNGVNSFVRIVSFDREEKRIIRDVEYKDQTYYVTSDYREYENIGDIVSQIGYDLVIRDHKDFMDVFVEDKLYNQIPIIFYEH